MTITAKIICDSVAAHGVRITTMELIYPRFIHSELMTHRKFSRNSASSRAIPIERIIQSVVDNPAMPIHWGRNQPGMQAKHSEVDTDTARELWLDARDRAVDSATELNELGLHKQVVNRVLEPFMHMTTLVTSTEWDNFFSQRISKEAQPEINALAIAMKTAMDDSVPKFAKLHVPYILEVERDSIYTQKSLIALSVARCCRVSYLKHGSSTTNDVQDMIRYNELLRLGHWSPFEHVAIAADNAQRPSGNFTGWLQHREEVDK